MRFRCLQQKNALEIKQIGKTGLLLLTARRVMDTCVHQTKTLQISWNSVTYFHEYWLKKVWKIDIITLVGINEYAFWLHSKRYLIYSILFYYVLDLCLYLVKRFSRVNSYNCRKFTDGCPELSYFSSETYIRE